MRGLLRDYLVQGWRIAALFALFVALSTLTVVGAPKVQQEAFEDQTAHEISGLAEISRALTAQTPMVLSESLPSIPLSDQFAPVGQLEFPPALAPLVGQAQYSVTGQPLGEIHTEAPLPPGLKDRHFAVIMDSEALERVEFVRGHPPEPNPLEVEAREITDPHDLRMLLEGEPEPIDVALSTENSRALGLDVGDEIILAGFRGITTVRISGVFTPHQEEELVWQTHLRARSPYLEDDPNSGVTAHGAVLAHPGTPQWLTRIADSPTAQVRVPITAIPADTPALTEALVAFTADRYAITEAGELVEFTSRLTEVLSTLHAQHDASAHALAMILTGPVGASFAVAALLALISRRRRSPAHALMLARGASPAQLRTLGAVEGILIGIPAALIGLAAGNPVAGALMALLPVAALASAPLPTFIPTRTRAQNRWRITGAIAVLGVTGAAIYTGNQTVAGDPLVLALPVLLAASVTILLLLVLPLLMRGAHLLARRSRGVVAFLGSARATRASRAGWPLLTLVLTVGAAVFSATMFTTIDAGARAHAYAGVGADVRLSTGWLTSEDQEALTDLPGVLAGAAVHRLDSVHLRGPAGNQRVSVFAVDTHALARAQVNFDQALDLTGLAEPHGDGVPALIAPHIRTAPGEELAVHVGSWLPLDVSAQPEVVPGVVDSGAWVVLDITALSPEARAQFSLPRLMLLATDGQVDTARAVHAVAGGVVTTPHEALASLTDSPLVAALADLSWWALVLSAVFAAVGVTLFLVLTAPQRGYIAAILHTLGGRSGAGLTAWEVLPVITAGVGGGLGLGVALPHLTSLDLRVFTGSALPPPVMMDWTHTGIVLAVVGGVALAGVIGAGAAGGRRAARAIRIGE